MNLQLKNQPCSWYFLGLAETTVFISDTKIAIAIKKVEWNKRNLHYLIFIVLIYINIKT